MPKTEIILTHNVVGLGAESDQVKVSAGYARNYLFPHGLAIPLSASNKRRVEGLKKKRAERESKELHSMSELGTTLSKLTLVIAVKTGEDGKMFGSVTSGSIADELRHQYEAHVDKRKIHLPHPIKALGQHDIELRLHPEVVATLKVRLDSTTPLSAEVQAALAQQQAARDKQAKQDAEESKGDKRPAKAVKSKEKSSKADKTAEKPAGEKKTKAPRAEKSEKPAKE